MYSTAPNGAPAFSIRKTVKSVFGLSPLATMWNLSLPTASVVRSTVTVDFACGKHAASCGEDVCSCSFAWAGGGLYEAGAAATEAVGDAAGDAAGCALAYAVPPSSADAARAVAPTRYGRRGWDVLNLDIR